MSMDMLTPEAAAQKGCNVVDGLDEDMIASLSRLRDEFGIDLEALQEECLKPLIDTFLPLVILSEQGKLTADRLVLEVSHGIERYMLKLEVAKSRFDKDVKEIEKTKKAQLRSNK